MEREKRDLQNFISNVLNNSKDKDIKNLSKSIDKLAESLNEYNKNYKKFLHLENKKIILEARKLNNE
jgi:hypothetical protein